ncbi:MAG: bestrophin family ion channel [Myxococcota bacterium]
MHVGKRYGAFATLRWSWNLALAPLLWSLLVVGLYELGGIDVIALPLTPVSLVGTAVAFYIGFQNNAAYDRTWEARKIYGAIVNASRSFAYGARDLVSTVHGGEVAPEELDAIHRRIVHRHVAWMDALRHQLRKLKSWEHDGSYAERVRTMIVPERSEELKAVVGANLEGAEADEVLAQINPAAHLIAAQSRDLAVLRARGLLDGFSHVHLQGLLDELMTQQGKAERIKNFPFPRQFATVNTYFAWIFCAMVPAALIEPFESLEAHAAWAVVPFSTAICWVFLTADKIGDWSENPFEGLTNDVPITSMSRGIERDVRQMVGETELPPARQPTESIVL